MKKKSFLMISMFLFLLIAQNSWAIQIKHISGEIYAETKTDYLSGGTWFKSGWDASGGAFTDPGLFVDSKGAYGYASGQKINGQSGLNHARFILSSTAQSANGMTGEAFYAQSTVRSGLYSGDMIEFQFVAEPGEEGKAVELTAQAVIAGTLNSGGLNGIPFPGYDSYKSGIASVDFIFQIYKNPTQSAIMSFTYSDTVQMTDPEPWQQEATKPLPGLIGKEVNSENFMVGDVFYVYFEQTAIATVSSSLQCSAKSFAVQSTEDVISIAIDAKASSSSPAHSPEPSTWLLLFVGFILLAGVPAIRRRTF